MAGLLTSPASDPVTVELRRWAALPFEWGETCCAMSVLDYVERVTGRQLDNRPAYSGLRAAARLMQDAGGFETMCRSIMAQLGCEQTGMPLRGDVGLCELPSTGTAACLCVGTNWAARMNRGVLISPVSAIIAWRVPCLRP